MNYKNLIKVALKALSNNKFRGFLTMLGIIIGVGSVIAMLAIGQGSKRSIREQISEMGSNMIMIHPGTGRFGGVRQSASSMQTLKIEDYKTIITNPPTSVPVRRRSTAAVRRSMVRTTLRLPSTESIRTIWISVNIRSAKERCLPIRMWHVPQRCVWWDKPLSINLFPEWRGSARKDIRFGKIPFKIIGVLTSKGYNSMGMDQDDLILAPYTTVQKRILAITYLQGIFASAVTEELSDKAIDELTAILRQNHNIRSGEEDDFNIRSQEELSSMMSSTSDLMTVLLACIAGFLTAGRRYRYHEHHVCFGDGATREIGLRMSIGAKGRHILWQIPDRSGDHQCCGGIIGVLLGIGAAAAIKYIAGWPVFVQPYSVILSFAVCTVTGIFFGWYPAKKASNLDPIEAIRYE